MQQTGNAKNFNDIATLGLSEKEELKALIGELVDSLGRQAAEKDFQKDALERVCDKLGVDKKIVKQMATTRYADSYEKKSEEQQAFLDAYEQLFKVSDE